jgi:hypothetical protein
MENKVVLHFAGGKIQKGTTENFFPNKELFHFKDLKTGTSSQINFLSLKAVFFVKNFDGNPAYHEKIDAERVGFGKKIRIVFKDGETLIGYTQGFTPNRPGFIVFPADSNSNNERIFVITKSTSEVKFYAVA